jgi:hypothetical protein
MLLELLEATGSVADDLGTTLETLSSSLTELKRAGVIRLPRPRIMIVDVPEIYAGEPADPQILTTIKDAPTEH